MKAKSFTEKRKLKSGHCESEPTMKKRRKYRAGKYSINEEVNLVDSEDYIITIIEDGETIMDVECGTNKAKLTLEKLWQGSKGQCIDFQGSWLTPNEFQYVSGRETAKDWKRSIRHQGKSIKLLLSKGYIKVTTDGLDEENINDKVQNIEGKIKRKGKGGRRRKTKAIRIKTPVLVDIPSHVNGLQIAEQTADDTSEIVKVQDNKQSESADESLDGNETDETIENYYSENELGYTKEMENVSNKKFTADKFEPENYGQDKNTTDYNQNVETETEDDENNANMSATQETNLSVRMGSDHAKEVTEKDFQENNLQSNSGNIDTEQSGIVVPVSTSSSLSCHTKESHHKEDDGAQTRKTATETSAESVHDAMEAKLKEDDVVNCDGEQRSFGSPSLSVLHTKHTDEIDTMPSIVNDSPYGTPNRMSHSEIEDDSLKTADSPPVLVSQIEELDTSPELWQKYNASTADENETVNRANEQSNFSSSSKKTFLSLPLKNSYCKESTLESAIESNQFDNASNVKTEVKNIVSPSSCLIHPPSVKRNKRKRPPKYVPKIENEQVDKIVPIVGKVDKLIQDVKLVDSFVQKVEKVDKVQHIPTDKKENVALLKHNTTTETDAKMAHREVNKNIEEINLNKERIQTVAKKEKIEHFNRNNSSPSVQRNSEDLLNVQNRNRKSPNEERKTDDRSCKPGTFQNSIFNNCKENGLKCKNSGKNDNNILINLSSTVPRMNGEMLKLNADMRTPSLSPLQNSYDEYMRRLELSHNAMSWNPLFPFIQAPRQYNSIHMPPLMSPYPPLLGNIFQTRDSYPDSLKTPRSSPLQSPFIATSPPSFEIPRLTALTGEWQDQSLTSRSDDTNSFPPKSKTSLSENSPMCLTIKPAHSVKPDSLCSGIKRGPSDSSAPLDLSIKRTKIDNDYRRSSITDIRKQKEMGSRDSRHDHSVHSEIAHSKKHRKLKHLWINKTDNQTPFYIEKCTCREENIENWSTERVCHFINMLDGCSPYSDKFREYKLSGVALHSLTRDLLIRGLGMKVGPAIVLMDAINKEFKNSIRRSQSCNHCRSHPLRDEHQIYV